MEKYLILQNLNPDNLQVELNKHNGYKLFDATIMGDADLTALGDGIKDGIKIENNTVELEGSYNEQTKTIVLS